MKKRIGTLGGINAASTSAYCDRMIESYHERLHVTYYPEIVIFSLDFQRFTDLDDGKYRGGDSDGYVEEIMSGIAALESAGVEIILMAANSPHAVFDEIDARAAVPMLSIVQVMADAAKESGLGGLLLLGIKFTMQARFYQEACARRRIDVTVPTDGDQDRINAIIFDELARGIIKEESKNELLGIIDGYEVDGVMLGCTELPLLLDQGHTSVTLLDTMEWHVQAALDLALG